jgi:hypothetical protein
VSFEQVEQLWVLGWDGLREARGCPYDTPLGKGFAVQVMRLAVGREISGRDQGAAERRESANKPWRSWRYVTESLEEVGSGDIGGRILPEHSPRGEHHRTHKEHACGSKAS